MDFKEASLTVSPFKKYKGRTFDEIATDDEGLKYLDWLYGEIDKYRYPTIYEALKVYLEDPSIKADLENIE